MLLIFDVLYDKILIVMMQFFKENKCSMIDEIQNRLFMMADEEYKNFNAPLMPTVDANKVIGIRVPRLRKYAKSLKDYEDFLDSLPHQYFEENNLHAFLIERETDFDKCIILLDKFLPYVDNWATCDLMKPKVLKKHPERLILKIRQWLRSSDTYTVRYAINLLMSFYLDDEFKNEYLDYVADISSEEYYINMMRAWYFATAMAKQYDSTISYIENKRLDKWTHNKTIQKCVESLRISDETKEYLKALKMM